MPRWLNHHLIFNFLCVLEIFIGILFQIGAFNDPAGFLLKELGLSDALKENDEFRFVARVFALIHLCCAIIYFGLLVLIPNKYKKRFGWLMLVVCIIQSVLTALLTKPFGAPYEGIVSDEKVKVFVGIACFYTPLFFIYSIIPSGKKKKKEEKKK